MKKRLLAILLGATILSNSTLSLCAEEINSVSNNTIYSETELNENDSDELEEIFFTIDGINNSENFVLPKDNTLELLKNTETETLDCARASISLPASYDGRQYQTAVKKQYGNTCWIYANIAAVEASMIKSGLADRNLDLSELHHIYFYHNRITDPLGGISGDYVSFIKNGVMTTDFASYVNAGGEKNTAISRLLNRVGPVLESKAPFTSATQGYIANNLAFGNNATDVVGFRVCGFNPTESQNIKELIYTYGAVTSSYYSVTSSKYYKNTGSTMSYYYPTKTDEINHSVIIVGWNDNYSASNFAQTPPGNGAWLCKNSWGTENPLNSNGSPVDGYFWLSYYDGSYLEGCAASTAFITEKANTDKYLYQYDGSCFYVVDCNNKSYLNIFKTKGMTSTTESLDAVSVYVGESTGYSIKVYINPIVKNGSISSYDYVSEPQHCISKETGVYKTRLNKPIYISKGDTFAVEVIMDNPASYIGYSKHYSDSNRWYNEEVEENTFYYQTEDGVYEEMVNGSYCIKAFTNDATVTPATSVSLSDDEITMTVDETYQITATVAPATALQQVRYTSTDPSVATVDNKGNVTAVGKGNCQIKVTSWDNKVTATCDVKVANFVKEIIINTEPSGLISIKKGQTVNLTANVSPENADDKSIEWGCEKNSIASITQAGKITGKNVGQTNITAMNLASRTSASAKLYVINPVTEIKVKSDKTIENNEIVLYTNDTNTATVTAETNSDATISDLDVANSDSKIATYDKNTGKITALKNGTTYLTFTSQDGAVPSVFNANGTVSAGTKVTQKIKVRVETKVESFSFLSDEVSIGTGQQTMPSGNFSPSNVSNKTVKYTSSDPEIAYVNENGYVVGKKPGTVTITGTPLLAKDSTVKDTIKVNVTQYVDEVQAPDNLYLDMGKEITIGSNEFNPIALPATASNRNLSYELKCSDGSVKLEGNVLKGNGYGQAQLLIKAEDSGEVKKTVNVYCVKKATWLLLLVNDLEFSSATTVPIGASVDENATIKQLKWQSSDETIATITDDAQLTITGKAGVATITVSTIDGSNITKSFKVTVKKLVQSLVFDNANYYMTVGETKKANVQIAPQDVTNKVLAYQSSNPYVATVQNGVITAVAEGTTIITATTTDGTFLNATTFVTVSKGQQATQQNTPQKEEQKEEPKKSNVGKEFISNGLKYKVMTETEVRCNGPKSKTTKKATIPSSVKYNNISYEVTSIKDSAFSGCKKLSEVNLPKTLESIGKKSFKGCTKLTTITIPLYVTTIGNEAFSGCGNMKSITIGGSVKTIGKKAFYKCKALKKVTIPSSVTTIGSSAFYGCTAMTSAVIGNNVTSIESKAFYGCKKLKKIEIKSTKLKTIGSKAFYKVAKKCEITMPASKKKAYKKLLKGKYSAA